MRDRVVAPSKSESDVRRWIKSLVIVAIMSKKRSSSIERVDAGGSRRSQANAGAPEETHGEALVAIEGDLAVDLAVDLTVGLAVGLAVDLAEAHEALDNESTDHW